ncbi:MAG: hypothetical protein KKB31_05575, partial [Nanoarchaeota archaeon]|nr:hypothetical protein [Nanoarchaeota archaeon]
VSRGHTLIIPKIHSEKIPTGATELAKQIAELLKTLRPKKIDIYPSNAFGHEILNVIPVYKGENLESPRKKAKQEDLQKIQKELETAEKPKIKKPRKPRTKRITEKNTWLPRRIP